MVKMLAVSSHICNTHIHIQDRVSAVSIPCQMYVWICAHIYVGKYKSTSGIFIRKCHFLLRLLLKFQLNRIHVSVVGCWGEKALVGG